MSRRPFKNLMDRFFPARVSKSLTITATGTLGVVVTPTPPKGYTTTLIDIIVSWYPASGTGSVNIDFGDGYTDSAEEMVQPAHSSHIYNTPGSFTIRAWVTDDVSHLSGSGSATVQVASPLTAELTADKTSGPVPLAVNFTVNIAGGYPSFYYTLDFGDGFSPATGYKNVRDPFTISHTYNTVGTYTVTLTVDDATGSSVQSLVSIGAVTEIRFPKLRNWFPNLFKIIDGLKGSY